MPPSFQLCGLPVFCGAVVCKAGRTYVCVNIKKVHLWPQIAGGVCSVGVPGNDSKPAECHRMTVLNNCTAGFGEQAVAAMGIGQKLAMIPMQVSMGLSQGIMPLVGYNYASKNVKRMRKGFTYTAKISLGMMLLATAAYLIFCRAACPVIYGRSPGCCLWQPFFARSLSGAAVLCMDFLAVGVFQACGMGKMALLFAFLRKIILRFRRCFYWIGCFRSMVLPHAQLAAEFVLALCGCGHTGKTVFRLAGECTEQKMQ